MPVEPGKQPGWQERVNEVLDAVYDERYRQDRKWGQQDWPDGTGGYDLVAASAKADTDTAAQDGSVTYRHILMEEFYEALAETDKEKLKTELIQVAAVAVAWVEKLIREERKAAA